MPLDILRTIIRGYGQRKQRNYEIIKILEKHGEGLSSREIQTLGHLSRKQLYTSLHELKTVYAIRRHNNGNYKITELCKKLLQHLNAIEELERKILRYKLRDLIERERELNALEKEHVLEELKI